MTSKKAFNVGILFYFYYYFFFQWYLYWLFRNASIVFLRVKGRLADFLHEKRKEYRINYQRKIIIPEDS